MRRFYLEPERFSQQEVLWNERESHHICRVLRLESGTEVLAFDGQGNEYRVRLTEVSPEQVKGEIQEQHQVNRENPIAVELIQGIAKAEKMDWIIQKAVELGVSEIRPLFTRYTVVKLEKNKREKKRGRWASIACEACKQCRGNCLPIVHTPQEWADFLAQMSSERCYILLYEATQGEPSLKELLRQERERIRQHGISLLIGSEGGWSETEIEQARQRGIYIAGLGSRILRTETAGVVSVAAVLYEMDAWE